MFAGFEDKVLDHNFWVAVRAFDKCDPQELYKLGAPADEYDFEAMLLAECITDDVTFELLQGAVYGLLYRSFGSPDANMADRIAACLVHEWTDSGHELSPVEQLVRLARRLDEYMPEQKRWEASLGGIGVAVHFIGKLSL